MIDYYKILGIGYTEDQKIIHEAFRKMALKYHPDINHNTDSNKKFEAINKAYEILSDERAKLNYDIKYLKIMHATHKFVKRYSGENDKVYSNDSTSAFNSRSYSDTKNEFSS